MSADTPANLHDTPARNDHTQAPEPDRTRPAEHAPSKQDGSRPQQPAQSLNRADYNRARHDQPPVQRPGDDGRRVQGDTTARAVGSNGDRRADQASPGHPAETARGSHPRPDSLNRADHNRGRLEAPPIQQPGDSGRQEPPGAAVRAGDGDGTSRADHRVTRGPAETVTREQPREETLNRTDHNLARHAEPPIQRQAERSEDSQEASGERQLSPGDADHDAQREALVASELQGEGRRQEAPSAGDAEAGSTAAVTGEQENAADEDSKAGRQTKPEEPEKVYVDGYEIEVTGDPADGIWIQGLPGEVPDRIGDVLTSEKDTAEKTRGGKLLDEAVEISEDFFESVEKNVNLASQVMERPPTHAEVPVSVHPPASDTQHHAPEAGSLATGVLALGIMLWAGGRWISGRLGGAHDARDR